MSEAKQWGLMPYKEFLRLWSDAGIWSWRTGEEVAERWSDLPHPSWNIKDYLPSPKNEKKLAAWADAAEVLRDKAVHEWEQNMRVRVPDLRKDLAQHRPETAKMRNFGKLGLKKLMTALEVQPWRPPMSPELASSLLMLKRAHKALTLAAAATDRAIKRMEGTL